MYGLLMSFAYWNSKQDLKRSLAKLAPRQTDANDEARKRGREKHWETFPKSKFGKYFDTCNSR